MRRSKQLLSMEETIEILKKNTHGTLAIQGLDGYPYSLPISYVYANDKIYFHCASDGYKTDCLKQNNKVSFSVVDQDLIVPEKFTTYFKSAIAFGTIRFVESNEEKIDILKALSVKYTDESMESTMKEINQFIKVVCILEMNIDSLTGKQAIELVK